MDIRTNQFRTSNFHLSAYLICKGISLLDLDRTDPQRVVFIFEDTDKRIENVQQYQFGKKALVDVRQYVQAMRELKERLYDR